MNHQLDDDELVGAVRRLEPRDPLPPVDPAALIIRGRRGLRRRRVLAAAGSATLVAAVAASAALLPNLGDGEQAPAANSTGTPGATAAKPGYLRPVPGVARGEAALGQLSRTEAERRCKIANPSGGRLSGVMKGWLRGGARVPYVDATGRAGDPTECAVPGDSLPTAAGRALLRSQPLPRDDAGLLLNCSLRLRHDLRSWRIIVKDSVPGIVTTLIASSPSGRYVAKCWVTADGSDGGFGTGIGPADPEPVHPKPGLPSPLEQLKYFGNSASKCPVFGARCRGSVHYDTTRTDPRVTRIRFRSTTGHHEVAVHDGWYAVAWNDRSGHIGFGSHLTAYDKNGRVLLDQ